MRNEIYSETSRRLLFTMFDASKSKKTDMFRIHHHTELELGYIIEGNGAYILNGRTYEAAPGRVFLVCPNEQHCVPTITTPKLVSFNIHITSYYLWNVCSEYIEPGVLRALIAGSHGRRCFDGMDSLMLRLKKLSDENAGANRFRIRRTLLELIGEIAANIEPEGNDSEAFSLLHLDDIQNAVAFISENLTEQITLDDIARSANLSRSHLSTLFKRVTGIAPYEFLLLQRVDKAIETLRISDETILVIAQQCGFCSLANFNKTFKKVTNMTPSDYRSMKRKEQSK